MDENELNWFLLSISKIRILEFNKNCLKTILRQNIFFPNVYWDNCFVLIRATKIFSQQNFVLVHNRNFFEPKNKMQLPKYYYIFYSRNQCFFCRLNKSFIEIIQSFRSVYIIIYFCLLKLIKNNNMLEKFSSRIFSAEMFIFLHIF